MHAIWSFHFKIFGMIFCTVSKEDLMFIFWSFLPFSGLKSFRCLSQYLSHDQTKKKLCEKLYLNQSGLEKIYPNTKSGHTPILFWALRMLCWKGSQKLDWASNKIAKEKVLLECMRPTMTEEVSRSRFFSEFLRCWIEFLGQVNKESTSVTRKFIYCRNKIP